MTGPLAEQSALDRFVHALARIVHDEHPEALSRPITVAELYQDIAPYRRMRELAGIEIHADYEHALIRLLAGEGGHAQLDPESAADELGIEAESSDPDLALYRKFAGCDVRLSFPRPEPSAEQPQRAVELPPLEIAHPHASQRAQRAEPLKPAPAPEPEPVNPDPVAQAEAVAPAPPKATLAETMRALEGAAPLAAPQQTSRPAKPTPAKPAASKSQPTARAEPRCASCGHGLPQGRDVHFCPYCGADRNARQCASCGEGVEAGWRFCIACGAAADS